jgi:hypothetical protein
MVRCEMRAFFLERIENEDEMVCTYTFTRKATSYILYCTDTFVLIGLV